MKVFSTERPTAALKTCSYFKNFFFFLETNLTIPVKAVYIHFIQQFNFYDCFFYKNARKNICYIDINYYFLLNSKKKGLHKKSQRMKCRNRENEFG